MAQIIIDSSNNLIQGDFDNATVNNRTKFKTTTLNGTTNVYAVPNGSSTSAGYSVSNNADPTNASKITIATNGATDTQIISGVNGSGTYLPMSFYTNNTLAMQITTAGNILVASTAAPAFSAYQTAAQTGISPGVTTKVTFDTEEFDTNNNFASSRFTPTVTGYYQLSGGVQTGGSPTVIFVELWKNGSVYKRFGNSASSSVSQISGSSLIYLNGSTDYAELYLYFAAGTSTDNTNQSRTWFNGCMVRSA